jgi:protein O-GlcNAc transferase
VSRLQLTLQSVEQFLNSGKHEDARQLLMRSLQKEPNSGPLCNAMAVTLVMLRQYPQAQFYAEKAVKLLPGDGEAASTLGSILAMMGKSAQALPVFERAVSLSPRSINARLGLANALGNLNRYSDVIDQCQAGLAVNPDDLDLNVKLTLGLLNCGRAEDAVRAAQRARAANPADSTLASWHAFALNYLPDIDPVQIRRAHEEYGTLIESAVGTHSAPSISSRDGILRIGLLSPDLRTHSVAFFVEPLLRHFDRSKIEIYCYSTAKNEDKTSERLKSLATQWRQVAGASDAELTAKIRGDGVAVLIDLAGHTSDNSLAVFAMRPAAVQATWCGYPSTTGVRQIAYRLIDSLTDPVGSDAHCVERLVRLDPSFLCYQPPEDAPAVAPSPSTSSQSVTFGSFNTLLKLNSRVVQAWSEILTAVPGSKLMLKATQLADARVRGWTVQRFAEAGVDPARIEVVEATASQRDHLGLYARLDIALDPFPYAGTTTTCEALWMGVPVLTLEGVTHAGRVGVSLLNNVGHPDLIARDVPSYIKMATALAGDRKKLAELRRSLRPTMAASTLCNGPDFAQRFEAAMRAMVGG